MTRRDTRTTEALVVARVPNRTGALERVLGLARLRAMPVHRLSLTEIEGGAFEVVLRVDADARTMERVRVELESLVDLLEVRELVPDSGDETDELTRELLLVRVPTEATEAVRSMGRVVAEDADGVVLEITGSPQEIERALEHFPTHNQDMSFVRSGELAVPAADSKREAVKS